VVFSDATMDNMRQWDPETADEIQDAFNHWDDIELRFKGRASARAATASSASAARSCSTSCRRAARQLGVEAGVRDATSTSDLDYADADLIIASDGINSASAPAYAEVFQPDIVTRPNRYIWLGTRKLYDAFTFDFEKTEHGWFQAHIYKFDDQTSTFIVECPEARVWQAHGLDQADQEQSIAFCEKLCSPTTCRATS
jgi:anthraniloyl-CoA monooxygenase